MVLLFIIKLNAATSRLRVAASAVAGVQNWSLGGGGGSLTGSSVRRHRSARARCACRSGSARAASACACACHRARRRGGRGAARRGRGAGARAAAAGGAAARPTTRRVPRHHQRPTAALKPAKHTPAAGNLERKPY